MAELTHFDNNGNAHMVDISEKQISFRIAKAACSVHMSLETLKIISDGSAKKGDVLSVARIAGIQGAKRTSELIPLCHPISLTKVNLDLILNEKLPGIEIIATAKTTGPTGVEMEALTAAGVSALTVYDMVKSLDKSLIIKNLRLILKDGGKSGRYESS
ncbi:MAG: cyclic pyranopterin monophosphate synthase MoaC [Paracoccaceae bacterium]|jgi:cyclic pyranopterin phosphate synthase|tara:strand:+ start:91 stop:567 length:477 start_codon:yes stop_codon:yes gene_type:complete